MLTITTSTPTIIFLDYTEIIPLLQLGHHTLKIWANDGPYTSHLPPQQARP